MKRLLPSVLAAPLVLNAALLPSAANGADQLHLEADETAGTITVSRSGAGTPILTQNARPDFRPYLHPLVAPDGKGVLTEHSPEHHRHQTGIYWGFTRVNGRDYFHHPGDDYWRRVAAGVLENDSERVQWHTVYDLLGEDGEAVLTETQTWSMEATAEEYVLELEWVGEARTDVTIGEYDYGGLFVRMPWRPELRGEVINAARQRGARAEGQRAIWLDVGLQVDGRDDLAHITIFDHASNRGFPQRWRVDGQLGVGPVPTRGDEWRIGAGSRSVLRYQLRVFTGALDDVSLTAKWSRFTGQGGTWAQWGVAQAEGRAAALLSPEEAVKAMTVTDGFAVNVFAAEPMITQPMAFAWDDRGRMWIAENRDYESRGGGFSSSGDSRILILEDTDRDGRADTRKVFSEGIAFPAGIALGFGGLWLGAPPNLLFLPDRDGDDRADDDIEVRLTGWGIRDRHETLNSFHWGPDGWLYGCQGFATPSRVGKPRAEGRIYRHNEPFPESIELEGEGTDIDGGVWRYHPTKDRFEVVAHGFSNPWGIDYDAKGQLFISACVIPHLFHVIPGGIYLRQGGSHFNRHVYSDIDTITDHRHRSAHGGARVYLSDAFPERYHGRLFMANIHEHAVLTDVLERKGSGFVGRHGDDFLLANNAQWVGFSMEIGPEGGVYVLDWHDADICGKEVVQKETGRVFRIVPLESAARDFPLRHGDLGKASDLELAELQLSPSAWHARRARVILQGRAAAGRVDDAARVRLREVWGEHADPDIRLRALWALHVTGGLPEADLIAALSDRDEHVRAWSVQLLCEDLAPPEAALARFAAMAAADPSAVVRLYLAAALQRVTDAKRWPIASALVRRSEDADDHNIPKMIWFGVEPLVVESPERALELAKASALPLVTRHIARRLADAEKLSPLVDALAERTAARKELLRGMRDGLEGRFDVTAPEGWTRAYASLEASGDGDVRTMALELAQQLGDNAAVEALFATVRDTSAATEDRRHALRRLAEQKYPPLRRALRDLLDDDDLRRDVVRAMAAFDDERSTNVLLAAYPRFTPEEKLEAVHTLAARPRSGWELTQAIRRGDVPRRDVPAYVARQLRRVVGSGFVEVWGPLDAQSAEREAEFRKYRALLTDEVLAAADPRHGRAVFERTCQSCHRMYGEGGLIGPEITGANRTDLDYVLGNVLTPSDVIQDAYRMTMVLTHEGRVFSGVVAVEDERQLSLRVVGEEEPVSIPKAAIASRELASVSMMPEGLLRELGEKDVIDLVAYLRTPEQVPLPEDAESE